MKNVLFSLCFVVSALGQTIVVKEINLPSGAQGQITRIETSPDGKLWLISDTGRNGVLLVQEPTGINNNIGLKIISTDIKGGGYPVKAIIQTPAMGILAVMGSFYPQTGDSITIGENFFISHGYKDIESLATITPPGSQQICQTYAVDGKATEPTILSGPTFFGNEKYYIGTEGKTSTIYLRGNALANKTCDLITKVVSDATILEAWKLADGSFLTQPLISAYPIATEIGILKNGVTTRLVSTNPTNNPRFAATKGSDMVVDMANQSFLISYLASDGGHAFVYQNGQIKEIYGNEDGLSSGFIQAQSLRGDWALFYVGPTSVFSQGKMLLKNIATGQKYVVADDNGDSLGFPPGTFYLGQATVTPQGIVYQSTTNRGANGNKLVSIQILGVTGFQPPKINSFTADKTEINLGDSINLTWQTTGDSVSIDNGVGFQLPASGSITIKPTQTMTFMLAAFSLGGITTATTTVIVNPAITLNSVVNGASFKAGLVAPGEIVSIFGANLSAQIAAFNSVPLPTNLAGVSVVINGGQSIPLYYVSPTQINAQIPYGISGESITLKVVTPQGTTNTLAVPLAISAPTPFSGPNGETLVDMTGNWTKASAVAGQVAMMFATGLGQVAPTVATGFAAPLSPLSYVTGSTTVTICGKPAQILFSGLTPGFVGLYQINMMVPNECSGGRIENAQIAVN